MGASIAGNFGNTKGNSRALYKGTSKGDALSNVSKLPRNIQKSVKSFIKGSSNNYNNYAVLKNKNGTYTVKMENPGRVPGSKAIYYKIIDETGKTIKVYKETFDPTGKLVHRKEK